jgi:putative transposase
VTRRERAELVGGWRYQIIRGAADESVAPSQRGRLVREIAERRHPGPFGGTVEVSRTTADRWIRAWRSGGFEALQPKPRQSLARTPAETLELAARLKQEAPERTAAQVKRIIEQMCGDAPSESTLLRHFRSLGLPQASRQVFGRFQADFPNEIWVGDFLHGPRIGGRKTYLAAFLDDYSRYVVAARWAFAEDTARLSLALRPALLAWGIPNTCYTDNGSSFKDRQFARACARLGIKMVHSAPGRPQGRGKVERFLCATRRMVVSPA